jgi:hypothetical protein
MIAGGIGGANVMMICMSGDDARCIEVPKQHRVKLPAGLGLG